jgi:ATP-dependent RNA helicase RhlE
MTFASLGLAAPLLQALETLGYKTPTPIQLQAIPAVLAGRDLMAAAQTGTGKTAGFALPVLQRLSEGEKAVSNSIRALVLVPTRELAEQVQASFRAVWRAPAGQHLRGYGGVSINPQMMRLRRGVDILVATPGRLLDLFRQNAIKFKQVETLILDEADRMLDLGFRPGTGDGFRRAAETTPDPAVLRDFLRRNPQHGQGPAARPALDRNQPAQQCRQGDQTMGCAGRQEAQAGTLPENAPRKTGAGVRCWFSSRRAKALMNWSASCSPRRVKADAIHGDKPQPARLRALESFKAGEIQILVATDVAARGLDIDDLPQVVNFDLPIVAEDYIHRIGRTGRAGATGEAISLVCADEAAPACRH